MPMVHIALFFEEMVRVAISPRIIATATLLIACLIARRIYINRAETLNSNQTKRSSRPARVDVREEESVIAPHIFFNKMRTYGAKDLWVTIVRWEKSPAFGNIPVFCLSFSSSRFTVKMEYRYLVGNTLLTGDDARIHHLIQHTKWMNGELPRAGDRGKRGYIKQPLERIFELMAVK